MKHLIILTGLAVLLAATGCGKYDESAGVPSVERKEPTAMAVQEGAKQPPAVAPKQVPQRSVIRNAALSVRVPNVEDAEDKVGMLVQEAGGYVDSAESSDLASATPVLTMSLRVPVAKFDATLDQFEKLGARLSKKVSSEDVTATVVDLAARLKIMRTQEEVYRGMLAKARSNQDLIDVQDKLMNLRGTIESLEAQHKSLSQLAALSSIELTLQQSAEGAAAATNDPNWAREQWGSALSALGSAARVGGTVLIWSVVFSPFWIPVVWYARRSANRHRPAPRFEVP